MLLTKPKHKTIPYDHFRPTFCMVENGSQSRLLKKVAEPIVSSPRIRENGESVCCKHGFVPLERNWNEQTNKQTNKQTNNESITTQMLSLGGPESGFRPHNSKLSLNL